MSGDKLNRQKQALFSHANPSYSIKEMKTVTTQLRKTRDLLHESLDLIGNVKNGISNTSVNISGTNSMYDEYNEKIKKSEIYLKALKRKEDENSRRIYWSFYFLIASFAFVFLRRIFFPDLYR